MERQFTLLCKIAGSGVQEFRSSGVEKIAFKIVNNPACTTRVHQDFFLDL